MENIIFNEETRNIIANGTWGSADWTLDSDGLLLIENGDLITHMHPQLLSENANKVRIIICRNVIAPVFAGGLFAANQLGDANQSFGKPGESFESDGFVNLTRIDVSGLDTTNTMNMNRMFDTQKHLLTIDGLNLLETKQVINMRMMFHGARIKYLDLSDFNMQGLSENDIEISQRNANNEISYIKDGSDLNPQKDMFLDAHFDVVKVGEYLNINDQHFYNNGNDVVHGFLDQMGNSVVNNDQLVALSITDTPFIYDKPSHAKFTGEFAHLGVLTNDFVASYGESLIVESGVDLASSMAQKTLVIDDADEAKVMRNFAAHAVDVTIDNAQVLLNSTVDSARNHAEKMISSINTSMSQEMFDFKSNLSNSAQSQVDLIQTELQQSAFKAQSEMADSIFDSHANSYSNLAQSLDDQANLRVASALDSQVEEFAVQLQSTKTSLSTDYSESTSQLIAAHQTELNTTSAAMSQATSQVLSEQLASQSGSLSQSYQQLVDSMHVSMDTESVTDVQTLKTSLQESMGQSFANRVNDYKNSYAMQSNSMESEMNSQRILVNQLIQKVSNLNSSMADKTNGLATDLLSISNAPVEHQLIRINDSVELINNTTGLMSWVNVDASPIFKVLTLEKQSDALVSLLVEYNQETYQLKTTPQNIEWAYYHPDEVSTTSTRLSILQDCKLHDDISFTDAGSSLNAGEIVSVAALDVYNGLTRFKLVNGQFVTANKYFVKLN